MSKSYYIPDGTFSSYFCEIVADAEDGDTIVSETEDMQESAKRAHQHICPKKPLTFRVRRYDENVDS